jgi:hypothetical protein
MTNRIDEQRREIARQNAILASQSFEAVVTNAGTLT